MKIYQRQIEGKKKSDYQKEAPKLVFIGRYFAGNEETLEYLFCMDHYLYIFPPIAGYLLFTWSVYFVLSSNCACVMLDESYIFLKNKPCQS